MKNVNRWIGVTATVLVLMIACQLFAQDWPQWRGANRDGKVTGFTAPKTWPSALKKGWQTTVGAGDATPALVGNRLYVFTRQDDKEVIACLDAADGKQLWENKYEAQAVTGAAAAHPGPRSSPAVANGKVVTLGVGGVLSCLDTASGKLLWRKDEFPKVVPQFFAAMSPIIVDGLCVAHLGGKGNGAVMAFDLTSGELKWKWAGDGPAYASPVLLSVEGTKQLVVQGEKTLVGLAVADGKQLWEVAAAAQGRNFNSATPIINGQIIIYTGQGKGTKAIKIEKQGDAFAVKEVWTNPELGTGFNTPVLKDGFLYGLSDKSNFFCLSAETGQTAWKDDTKRGSGNFCALLDAGAVMLALPSNSELIVFEPNSKQHTELAKLKVADTPTYAHPVVAGTKVFVKDKETVTLWSIE